MKRLKRSPARVAFTLIELLIVIFIIGILATLIGIYVAPSFSDNKNVIRAVDLVTIKLLTAKQRALRDQAPRGVRFITNSSNFVTQLQMIDLPSPLTGGVVNVTAAGATSVSFQGVDFVGAGDPNDTTYQAWNVLPGDYFRSPPFNYPIGGGGGGNTMTSLQLQHPLQAPGITAVTNQYQLVRQTRPTSGEAPYPLPTNVVIDLTQVTATNQIPNGRFPTPAGFFEIVFDIGGGVLNQGGNSTICMVIRDSTAANALDPNTTRVLAVYPRTGFISANPVAPSPASPLAFALDGKSSGM